jgi:hypothetical protein
VIRVLPSALFQHHAFKMGNNCVVKLQMFVTRISSSELAALFDATMQSGAIRMLNFNGMEFDATALTTLAMLMKRGKSVTKYRLNAMLISDDGATVICDALAGNNVIEELRLLDGVPLDGARSLG